MPSARLIITKARKDENTKKNLNNFVRLIFRVFVIKMKIIVKCDSGYRADETPKSILFDTLVVEVKEILDRWISPDHRYFKLLGDDKALYILRQETATMEWELTYYKRADEGRI